jgi:hypothetical protein
MLDLTADLKARLDQFKTGLDGVFLGPVIRDAERALRDCCQLIAGALPQPQSWVCINATIAWVRSSWFCVLEEGRDLLGDTSVVCVGHRTNASVSL